MNLSCKLWILLCFSGFCPGFFQHALAESLPNIVPPGPDLQYVNGTKVQLKCSKTVGQDQKNARLEWEFGSQDANFTVYHFNITYSSGEVIIFANLTIPSFGTSNVGTYTCYLRGLQEESSNYVILHMKVCPPGKYGIDCSSYCSEFCNVIGLRVDASPCHNMNGTCLYGCLPGYTGANCSSGDHFENGNYFTPGDIVGIALGCLLAIIIVVIPLAYWKIENFRNWLRKKFSRKDGNQQPRENDGNNSGEQPTGDGQHYDNRTHTHEHIPLLKLEPSRGQLPVDPDDLSTTERPADFNQDTEKGDGEEQNENAHILDSPCRAGKSDGEQPDMLQDKITEYEVLLETQTADFEGGASGGFDRERLEQELGDRNKTIKETTATVAKLRVQITHKDDQLKHKDDQLKHKDNQLMDKDDKLIEKDNQIADKDDQLRRKDDQLRRKDDQMKRKDYQLKSMQDKVNEVNELREEIEQLRQYITELKSERNSLAAQLEEAKREVREEESLLGFQDMRVRFSNGQRSLSDRDPESGSPHS